MYRSIIFRRLLFLLLLPLFLFTSCSKEKKHSGYLIGIDPSWYPLQVMGQEKNLFAFSLELLMEIAKEEHLPVAIFQMSWDNLILDLRKEKYEGILSSVRPYAFNSKEFSFSDIYLKTGPVLIVPLSSPWEGLDQIKGKQIGVMQGSSATLFLQKYPGIILHSYDSIPALLDAISNQDVPVGVLDILIAQKYVSNLYANKLKLASSPLTEEGLRLLTLFGHSPLLIKKFNQGLAALKMDGRYKKIQDKWGLSPGSQPVANLDQKIEDLYKLL